MTSNYGQYQDWETGDLDLAAVAAHAAAELDALERGVTSELKAVAILGAFLGSLAEQAGVHRPVGHHFAMAIQDAARTSHYSTAAAQSVDDIVREALTVAAELNKATGAPDDDRRQLRSFCLELSRAAMRPVVDADAESHGEFVLRYAS